MLYELVLLFRPDIVLGDLGDSLAALTQLIQKEGGSIEAEEYWGFRALAYRVEKRSKAHYMFLGIKMPSPGLNAIRHYLKFNKGILRFLFVQAPEGFQTPTALYVSSVANAVAGISQHISTSSDKEEESSIESIPERLSVPLTGEMA